MSQEEINLGPDELLDVCRNLHTQGYTHLSLITAVEWPEDLEIVYHIYSYSKYEMTTLRTRVGKIDPQVPSLTPVFASADWHERETYDLLGVRFTGHPNLRRILLPETFRGHPLRKDYLIAMKQMADMEEEMELAGDIPNTEGIDTERVVHMNMGPQHPSTHGVLRLRLLVEGEKVVRVYPVLGYLHRGMEKIAEQLNYKQFIPYTDRLDYVAGMINNYGYVSAIEKLVQVEVPERAEYLRVMAMELSRIASHLVWAATWCMDLGAITPFFYMMRDRERILRVFEELCGARMTLNYMRVGGVSGDMTEKVRRDLEGFLDVMPEMMAEYRQLVEDNEIIISRSKGIGHLALDDAIDLGVTGPMLRASGLEYDIRKAHPYSVYDRMKFKVPTRKEGDVYARYLVRMQEVKESLKIIEQALEDIPEGRITAKVPRIITPPAGDVYSRVESPKGELGFYVVSNGRQKPYRVRIRSPCFCNLASLERMAEGGKLADLVAINGSLDMIMGEVDR